MYSYNLVALFLRHSPHTHTYFCITTTAKSSTMANSRSISSPYEYHKIKKDLETRLECECPNATAAGEDIVQVGTLGYWV